MSRANDLEKLIIGNKRCVVSCAAARCSMYAVANMNVKNAEMRFWMTMAR